MNIAILILIYWCVGMPAVRLYLDEESYQVYKKLRLLLKELNKIRRTRLSVSFLFSEFLRAILPELEDKLDPQAIHRISTLKIDLPTLEINIGNVEIREDARVPRQAALPTMILWSSYRDWKRRYQYAMRISDQTTRMKTLMRLRNDIVAEIRKHKEAPKDLLDNIAKLLAKIDLELDKYYGVPTETQQYEYT